MIINKYTGFAIDKDMYVPEHMYNDVRKMLEDDKSVFVVPKEITDNQLKLVYKVGFLKKLYSLILPNTITNHQIYALIGIDHQVFKSIRQMERLNSQYLELYDNKEEN